MKKILNIIDIFLDSIAILFILGIVAILSCLFRSAEFCYHVAKKAKARKASYGWWAKYGHWCHVGFWRAMDHAARGGKIRYSKL